MAYLQFALLHIPSVVVQRAIRYHWKNSGWWHTRAQVMDSWTLKLRRQAEGTHETRPVPSAPESERPRNEDRPALSQLKFGLTPWLRLSLVT